MDSWQEHKQILGSVIMRVSVVSHGDLVYLSGLFSLIIITILYENK